VTLLEAARLVARHDCAGRLEELRPLARSTFPLGATRSSATPWFLRELAHYVYAGDTLLHVAAVAYDCEVARVLLDAGADVRARNRRGAEPLHYAADGNPSLSTWNPTAQAALVSALIKAGAAPNALDHNGVAPLHRAVRNRCTGAVRALLSAGADPLLPNKRGSTPLALATQTTGRSGAGSFAAKAEQAVIVRLLTSASQSD
jgi:ankyrin repeat protein